MLNFLLLNNSTYKLKNTLKTKKIEGERENLPEDAFDEGGVLANGSPPKSPNKSNVAELVVEVGCDLLDCCAC